MLGKRNEKNLSTLGCTTKKNPRLPCSDEDPKRPGCHSSPSCQGTQTPVGLTATSLRAEGSSPVMGKYDFRLRSPEEFRRALRSRPAGRSGAAVVYKISLDSGFRLGFVVPRKLIRHANQRNRVKRWSRELFKECLTKTLALNPATQPFALVVRLVGTVNPGWAAPRGPGRAELQALFEKATKGFIASPPTSGCP